jgi:antitoxin component YwqK of YwqJK toxin-antitoxin module
VNNRQRFPGRVSTLRCRRFWRRGLPVAAVFLLVSCAASLIAVLCLGNCQWNRWIYVFQDHIRGCTCPGFILRNVIRIIPENSRLTWRPDDFTGTWFEWHENGAIKYEVELLHGKCHGICKSWYDNGQLSSEGEYILDKKSGKHLDWYKNGQLQEECEYLNGEKHGKDISWHENGQKEEECEYLNGEEQGRKLCWDDKGQVEADCNYKNGQFHGKSIWYKNGIKTEEREYWERDGVYRYKGICWYENGQKSDEGEYLDFLNVDGKQTSWRFDGTKRFECNFKDGRQNGKFIEWYENGNKQREHEYKNNIEHGKHFEWFENGQLREEGECINGEATGNWRYWNETGELLRTKTYDNGELIKVVLPNGEVIEGDRLDEERF